MTEYFLHPSSYVDEDVQVGEGSKIWHFCHVQSGARIGSHCSLGQNVYVGSDVVIGNDVKIQNNVSVYEGVVLEDGVFCGPSCVFTNDLNPRARYPKGSAGFLKTIIGQEATIGANATIICGHRVGNHAMIAAGAVVADHVSAHALMAGVPARRIGWVCTCGHIFREEDKIDALDGGESGDYQCPDCQRHFHQEGEEFKEISK